MVVSKTVSSAETYESPQQGIVDSHNDSSSQTGLHIHENITTASAARIIIANSTTPSKPAGASESTSAISSIHPTHHTTSKIAGTSIAATTTTIKSTSGPCFLIEELSPTLKLIRTILISISIDDVQMAPAPLSLMTTILPPLYQTNDIQLDALGLVVDWSFVGKRESIIVIDIGKFMEKPMDTIFQFNTQDTVHFFRALNIEQKKSILANLNSYRLDSLDNKSKFYANSITTTASEMANAFLNTGTTPSPFEHLITPHSNDFEQFLVKIESYLSEKQDQIDQLAIALHEKSIQLGEIHIDLAQAQQVNETLEGKLNDLLLANQELYAKFNEMNTASQETSALFIQKRTSVTERKEALDTKLAIVPELEQKLLNQLSKRQKVSSGLSWTKLSFIVILVAFFVHYLILMFQ